MNFQVEFPPNSTCDRELLLDNVAETEKERKSDKQVPINNSHVKMLLVSILSMHCQYSIYGNGYDALSVRSNDY